MANRVKTREGESREAADKRGHRTAEKVGEILEDLERGMDDRTAHVLDRLVAQELEDNAEFDASKVTEAWVDAASEKAARIAAIPKRFAASSALTEGLAPDDDDADERPSSVLAESFGTPAERAAARADRHAGERSASRAAESAASDAAEREEIDAAFADTFGTGAADDDDLDDD